MEPQTKICKDCCVEKSIDEFYVNGGKRRPGRHSSYCKVCQRVRSKTWFENHEVLPVLETRTCRDCGIEKPIAEFYPQSKVYRSWYCKPCHRTRYEDSSRTLTSVHRLQDTVITGYGGKCTCCGETNPAFLTLDHVNGSGNIERRSKGTNWPYRDARDRNYPDDYQVLCYNCNCGRWRAGGVCPHKLVRTQQLQVAA
jgi:hypothetical protein